MQYYPTRIFKKENESSEWPSVLKEKSYYFGSLVEYDQ